MMLTRIARTSLVRQQRQRRASLTKLVISHQQQQHVRHAAAAATIRISSRANTPLLANKNDNCHKIIHGNNNDRSIQFFHTSLPLREKEEEEAAAAAAATEEETVPPAASSETTTATSSDATTSDDEAVQYSTPELTRDAAIHKAGMEDPDRPEWQNPLVHATGKTADGGTLGQIYREDFDSEEEFQAAVLPSPPLATTPEEEEVPPAPEYLEALAEEIVHLTVLEMNELKNKMGQHYGFHEGMLSPDDVDMVGGGDGDGGDDAGAAAEEKKTAFDLKLMAFDAKTKIKVIKEVRSVAGLGLKEAKELVEGAPTTILKDIKQEQAEEIKAKLEELGATVEIV